MVVKGYAQKYGIDYEETFSPVVRFSFIRTLLAYAVQNEMLIHQMDVITAILNGKLEEEIYMEQLNVYAHIGKEHLVCQLQKSLWIKAVTKVLEHNILRIHGTDPFQAEHSRPMYLC